MLTKKIDDKLNPKIKNLEGTIEDQPKLNELDKRKNEINSEIKPKIKELEGTIAELKPKVSELDDCEKRNQYCTQPKDTRIGR